MTGRWRWRTLAAALLGCVAVPLAAQTWPFPWPEDRIASYTARRASSPSWSTAGSTRRPGRPRNARRVLPIYRWHPGIHDTRAAVLWDDTYLYVGYWVEEPFVEATLTERDAPIYKNNDVELFIAGRDAYYEFEINALGTIYEVFFVWERQFERAATRAGRVRSHAPGRQALQRRRLHAASARPAHRLLELGHAGPRAAVHVDGTINDNKDRDRGWTVELRIPGARSSPWRCRTVARCRRGTATNGGWISRASTNTRKRRRRRPGRLGVEPARRVGLAHPRAFHPRAVLRRIRRRQVGQVQRSDRRVHRRQASRDVVPGHRARSDVEPVPAVDRHDRQAQVHQLVLRELLAHALVDVVGHTSVGDECERLGPLERRAFARRDIGVSPQASRP